MTTAKDIAALFDLTGRNAIVTAGASGIGLATAKILGAAGATVIVADIRGPEVEAEAAAMRADGVRALAIAGDVSDEAVVAGIFERAEKEVGLVDILINNAGLGAQTHPERLGLDKWRRAIDVNLTASFLMAKAFARALIAAGKPGCIVNTSSIAGTSALGRGNFVYSVAKAGLNQLTRELAVEWAGSGIRVNAVQPCQVYTPGFRHLVETPGPEGKALLERMLRGIPIGSMPTPENIAHAMLFLVSDAAAYVTGVMLPVDGGNLALNPGGTPRQTRISPDSL